MSVTTIIVFLIIGLLIFGLIGYGLWSWADSSYDYNIFNWGILTRGVIGIICMVWGYMSCPGLNINTYSSMTFDTGTIILLCVGTFLFLWNFISTLVNTNLIIALFSFIYQAIAIYFAIKIIGGILQFLRGE